MSNSCWFGLVLLVASTKPFRLLFPISLHLVMVPSSFPVALIPLVDKLGLLLVLRILSTGQVICDGRSALASNLWKFSM